MSKFNFFKDKNMVLAGVAIIGVIVVGVLIYGNSSGNDIFAKINFGFGGMSNDEIAQKSIDYINNSGLTQSPVSLASVSEESGLVKMKIKLGTSEFDSYATKDGKLLFPNAFDMDKKEGDTTATTGGNTNSQTAQEIIASIQKTDKPIIEAFIVSRCPFGLQMQRMADDAIKNIPELGSSIKMRYIGAVSGNTITAMHGDAEAQENLRQICIREEQSTKYWPYVSCQMKSAGQEVACEKSTGVNSAKLSSCISDVKRGVAYAKEDFDLSAKYNATGSPTLILSGAEVPEFTSDNKPVFGSSRSSDELRAIICAASNSQPSFCSTKLNTASAATSFSGTYEGSGSDSTANCGS